jgi:ribosomal protein L12E/L44/L45/RPP1/RPP2
MPQGVVGQWFHGIGKKKKKKKKEEEEKEEEEEEEEDYFGQATSVFL